MVMTTEGNVAPTPDHDAAQRPGGEGQAKTIRKGGSLPKGATNTGAGQGSIRTGWRGTKGRGR